MIQSPLLKYTYFSGVPPLCLMISWSSGSSFETAIELQGRKAKHNWFYSWKIIIIAQFIVFFFSSPTVQDNTLIITPTCISFHPKFISHNLLLPIKRKGLYSSILWCIIGGFHLLKNVILMRYSSCNLWIKH